MEFRLIIKKLNQTLTPQEEAEFDTWYAASEEHRVFFEKVKQSESQKEDVLDLEQSWTQLASKTITKSTTRKTILWKYAAAASIALLVGMGYLWKDTLLPQQNNVVVDVTDSQDAQRSNKVILTLEDGTDMVLEDEKKQLFSYLKSLGNQLVYTDEDDDTIRYNYLTIPRGADFFVQLADGSKVWLNSESKLKYPVSFVPGMTRKVELIYGEAYFDISPSTRHNGASFKVITNSQEVEVLGTEFNIKAYQEETVIATTLVEGKVQIDNGTQKKTLKPNEQSKIQADTDEIAVATVDVFHEISWRKGVFSFKEKPLKDVMRTLSRWYDVDVVFENQEIASQKFNGVVNKKQSMESILSILGSTVDMSYTIEGKKVIIK